MIRTLHFSDFLKLGRLHEAEVGLNLPDSLVVPNSRFSAALIQRLPVHSLSSSVYIYEEDGKPEAFAQACARRRSEEWNVLALGVVESPGNLKNGESSRAADSDFTGAEDMLEEVLVSAPVETTLELSPSPLPDEGTPPVIKQAGPEEKAEPEEKADRPPLPDGTEFAWLKLLEYLVVDAGERGVARVYAKLSTDSPEISLFSQTGFHSYTHESLFTLHHEAPLEQPPQLKLRPQRNRDAWFIDQLYHAVTPSFVKNSEQTLARDWEIHKSHFSRPVKEQGWVLEEGEKIVAYLRIMSNRHKHMVRFWNLDSHRGLLPDLVRFALSNLKAGPECYVYCTVREYQTEQEAVFEDAGFSYFGKQAVMVKHTVQYIRNPEKALAQGRDRKLELAHRARANLLVRLLSRLPFHYLSKS